MFRLPSDKAACGGELIAFKHARGGHSRLVLALAAIWVQLAQNAFAGGRQIVVDPGIFGDAKGKGGGNGGGGDSVAAGFDLVA